jgi:branched-chain amino acid transport system ATP-binding protein
MLEIADLNAFYGEAQALWSVSLRVETGEIVALVGPNGAGKTTLVSATMGLISRRSGSIRMEGVELIRLPSWRIGSHGLAIVPEGRRLFPGMSVTDNLDLGAFRAAIWSERKGTLEQIFTLFPILEARRKQLAGTLSGGEQQMLAIGRALMSRPRVLILDEPSLGVAPKVVDAIFDTIVEISKLGVSVLLIEQDVTRALEIANRAYFLNEGAVALEGSPSVMLANDDLRRVCLGIA